MNKLVCNGDCFNCVHPDCIVDDHITKEEIAASKELDREAKLQGKDNRGRHRAEYLKAYRAAHREEINAYQREWREAHREEINAYWREYYAAHREEYNAYKNAYQREWREAHREEHNAYHREYYAAHREDINARRREWYRKKKKEAAANAL